MFRSIPCTLLALVALSACGSTASGFDPDIAETLANRADLAPLAEPADLAGVATMAGFIAMEIDNPSVEGTVLGNMDVVADFDKTSISGTASDLGEYSSLAGCVIGSDCSYNRLQSIEGELSLVGTISGANFDGSTLTGQLTYTDQNSPSGNLLNADLNLSVTNSDFYADDEGLLASAVLSGTADISGTAPGAIVVTSDVDAGFVVAE